MFERSRRACTERCSGSSSRLPAAKRPDLVELDLLVGHGSSPQCERAATTPRSRRMFSACGPERRSSPRARARARRAPSRGRGSAAGRLEPVLEGVGEQRVQRALGDRPAAEARDHVVDRGRRVPKRQPHVLADDPAERRPRTPSRPRRPARACPSAARTSSSGNGRKHLMPRAPIFTPCSRSSSTTSSIVPSTEPSATTIVSASSLR